MASLRATVPLMADPRDAAARGRRAPVHPLHHLQSVVGNAAVAAFVQRQDEEQAQPVRPAQTRQEVEARQRRVAAAARAACAGAWVASRKSGIEHGAVLFEEGGVVKSAPTRIGSKKSDDSVDVGVHDANAGCPQGTMPVGYWHTHPLSHDPLTKSPREKRTGDDAFSEGDKAVARDNQLAAFVQDQFGFHELSVGAWYDAGTYTPWRPFPAR